MIGLFIWTVRDIGALVFFGLFALFGLIVLTLKGIERLRGAWRRWRVK